jgi:hypothetical protein
MATKKSKTINRCLIEVSNLPLERFRVPSPKHKWKNTARQLQALLMWLARFANGDGTFNRGDMNYSPSVERQTEHFSCKRNWIYKLQDDLKALGFLNWTRKNRQESRKYIITIPDPDAPDSNPEPRSDALDSNVPDALDSVSDVSDSNPDVSAAWTPDVSAMRTPSVSSALSTALPTDLKAAAGRLAQIFGQVTGSPLPGGDGAGNQKSVAKAMEIAPGRVVKFWKRWLSQRDLTGMRFPLGVFVLELPVLIATSKGEIDIEAERNRIAKIGEEERKKFWEEFGQEKPKISAEDAEKWLG